jgi:hypothetical protein
MLFFTDKRLRSAQSGKNEGSRAAPIESHRSVPEMGIELTMINIARSAASRESAHS